MCQITLQEKLWCGWIITSKQQKFSKSDPALIHQFWKKLQSDPVLIRPKLASGLIQSDPVLICAHLCSLAHIWIDFVWTFSPKPMKKSSKNFCWWVIRRDECRLCYSRGKRNNRGRGTFSKRLAKESSLPDNEKVSCANKGAVLLGSTLLPYKNKFKILRVETNIFGSVSSKLSQCVDSTVISG